MNALINPNIILGGPLFIRLTHLHQIQPDRIPQYRNGFISAKGQFDLYMLFIERAIQLLPENGRLSFSASNTFLRSASGRNLRRLIAEQCFVHEIVEFEDDAVYPDANTQIALLSLVKGPRPGLTRHVRARGKGHLRQKLSLLCSSQQISSRNVDIRMLPRGSCSTGQWHLESCGEARVATQIELVGTPLRKLPADVALGLCTGADSVFIVSGISHEYHGKMLVQRLGDNRTFELEAALLRPILRGRDITRYSRPRGTALCVCPYDDQGRPLDEDLLCSHYPLTTTAPYRLK